MTELIKIAGICGSLRKDSYNAKVLRAIEEIAPPQVELDIIRLDDIPLYNNDVEKQGWPAPVENVRQRVAGSDAVLFACPEYNYAVPGVLKNAIDWLSRPAGDAPLNGKPVTIVGATPGMVGTARAQSHMRDIVFYNAMPLLPDAEILIAGVADKFDDSGALTDEETRDFLAGMMEKFVDWIGVNTRL